MADEQDNQSGEKTEEPSSYRIEEFRKRGDVASSRELTSSIVLGSSFFVVSVLMIYLFETFSNFLTFFINLDPKVAFTEEGLAMIFDKSINVALKSSGRFLV